MTVRSKGFRKLPDGTVTCLLIDADSLVAIQAKIGWDIDIERLTDLVRTHYNTPRMVYFATVDREPTEAAQGFHGWLRYRGFELVLRPQSKHSGSHGRDGPGSGIPVEIAVEASMAPAACHHIILLSRNKELEPVGTALRRSHRTMTLVSDADCPRELRCSATHFVDLTDMDTILMKQPRGEGVTR